MYQRTTQSYLCPKAAGPSRELTRKEGRLVRFFCRSLLLAGFILASTSLSLGGNTVSKALFSPFLPASGEDLMVFCPSGADLDDNGIPEAFEFSTGPFNCTATLSPPAPLIEGGCGSYSWSFELWAYEADPLTGQEEYQLVGRSTGPFMTGIAPGIYDLRYRVIDNCGQEALGEGCPLSVSDAIDPIVRCREGVALTAGGVYADEQGIDVLPATALDGGSQDNCSLSRLLARRHLEASCLASYAYTVWGKSWPSGFSGVEIAGGDLTYFMSGGDTLLVREGGSYYSWWSESLRFTCCDGSDGTIRDIAVELMAVDANGNYSVCSTNVTYRGAGTSQAFSCIQGVVLPFVGLDADGDGQWDDARVVVEATDLLSSPAPACNGPLVYALNRVGEEPVPGQSTLEFSCADPRLTPINLEVHAWDQVGGYYSCETFVILQDEEKLCESIGKSGTLSGTITTEKGLVVPGVRMQLSGSSSATVNTDDDGKYSFENLDRGHSYAIRPSKDDDYLNGVTTYDLVLISKHIQGLLPLESPYLLIAADLNNSGTITTLDMIQLRQMVLSVDTEFRNNASWRFIDASYRFPNPVNPWQEPFPESTAIEALNGQAENNFIAVKIGDVNGNVVPRPLSELEERSEAALEFALPDRYVEAGDEVRIVLSSARLPDLEGMQFALAFDPYDLELLEVEAGQASVNDLGLFPAKGLITASWSPYFRTTGTSADPSHLLTLVFRSNNTGQLSELLQMVDRPTRPEAYTGGGEIMGVSLSYQNPGRAEPSAVLLPNQPNPFKDQTVVPFWLPAAAEVRFRIADLHGRLVRQFRLEGSAGNNELRLQRADFSGPGIWLLVMETKDYRQTIRLLVID